MSIANLLKKLFPEEPINEKTDDNAFWKNAQEKNKLEQECRIKEKEDKARMHAWTEAYLVYLHRFPAEKARVLADDATDIYMQKYNGEI